MHPIDSTETLTFLLFGPLLVTGLLVLAVNIYTWRKRRQSRPTGQVPPARMPSAPWPRSPDQVALCLCKNCAYTRRSGGYMVCLAGPPSPPTPLRRATDTPRLTILLPLLTVVLLIMFVAGCAQEAAQEWPATVSDVKDYETAGLDADDLQEFRLADGTRCITATYAGRGIGIACDFSDAGWPRPEAPTP